MLKIGLRDRPINKHLREPNPQFFIFALTSTLKSGGEEVEQLILILCQSLDLIFIHHQLEDGVSGSAGPSASSASSTHTPTEFTPDSATAHRHRCSGEMEGGISMATDTQ